MSDSSKERRSAHRTTAQIAVEILNTDLKGCVIPTCDISEDGTLLLDQSAIDTLHPGQALEIKITGLMGQKSVVKKAKVVRIDGRGVALHFDEPLE